MPYSTLEDIEELIPRDNLVALTDDAGADDIDAEKVDRAIADADAIIDSFLGGRYTVPITTSPLPSIVRQISSNIAIYKLYSRRFELEMPVAMRQRYEDAIAMLKRLESGEQIIVVDPIPESEITGGVIVGSARPAILPAALLRRMP